MANGNGRVPWLNTQVSVGTVIQITILLVVVITGWVTYGNTLQYHGAKIDDLGTRMNQLVPRTEFNLILQELSEIKIEIRELRRGK